MNRTTLWVILIFISILGVVFISGSGNQTTVTGSNENQLPNIHTGPINKLPIGSPTPANSKVKTQPKTINNTPNPYNSRASNMSSAIATVVFSDLGSERTKYIKQFANGIDDLALATHNFALMLDKNPNIAASILVYIVSKNSQGSSGSTTLDDLESKIDDLEDKIDELNNVVQY